MKIFKNEFARLFAVGFVAGSLAVAGMLDIDFGSTIAQEVMPVAVAAAPAH